ncbi:MAG TPA: 50S ribosomal protein L29 [Candidatus Paceibacterota bacterium]
MKKTNELKNKTVQDINKLIKEKAEALRHFRFGSTHSKTKNVKLGRTLRKEIARFMTELTMRAKLAKK